MQVKLLVPSRNVRMLPCASMAMTAACCATISGAADVELAISSSSLIAFSWAAASRADHANSGSNVTGSTSAARIISLPLECSARMLLALLFHRQGARLPRFAAQPAPPALASSWPNKGQAGRPFPPWQRVDFSPCRAVAGRRTADDRSPRSRVVPCCAAGPAAPDRPDPAIGRLWPKSWDRSPDKSLESGERVERGGGARCQGGARRQSLYRPRPSADW
jgi:hypothetical protein